jgi:hypothetical protein
MDPEDAPLAVDPRGLIREAYRMALAPADARAIFLDWALGLDGPADARAIATLLDRYGARHPDHPMTAVLREGLSAPPPARRRRRR